jgi:acyl carrier protein
MTTMPHALSVDARIRHVLRDHARLSADLTQLSENADLYDSGMTSHASVNLMLALENEFDVEFPDELLTRSVFSSIGSIKNALLGLLPDNSANNGSSNSG